MASSNPMIKNPMIKHGTGSLAGQLRKELSTLRAEKVALKEQAGTILLLDTSGSMGGYVDDKAKIDHLRAAVQDFPQMKKVSFSSRVVFNSIPNPNGGTNMAAGFRALAPLAPRRVVCVSDGIPDSEQDALDAARNIKVRVDVIYIGEPGTPGEAFMKRLAAATGGSQATVRPNRTELQQQVRFLLEHHS